LYSPVDAACGLVVACGEGAIALLEIEKNGQCLKGRELSNLTWTGRRFRT
jgi:hypothetical protein